MEAGAAVVVTAVVATVPVVVATVPVVGFVAGSTLSFDAAGVGVFTNLVSWLPGRLYPDERPNSPVGRPAPRWPSTNMATALSRKAPTTDATATTMVDVRVDTAPVGPAGLLVMTLTLPAP